MGDRYLSHPNHRSKHCTSWSDSMLQHSSDSVYVPMSLNLHHELRITEYKQYESK